jgi:hypothetical protein
MKLIYSLSKIIDISIILVIICISIFGISLSLLQYIIIGFIFGFILIFNHIDLYILYKNLDIKEELKDEKRKDRQNCTLYG